MIKYLKEIEAYVTTLLTVSKNKNLLFHNLKHTQDVVGAASEIAAHSNITETELDILIVSAWFHDCGYVKKYTQHEDESVKIAEHFLKELIFPEEFIEQVIQCINSTRYAHVPASLTEKIIRDADMYHLCKPNYPFYEELLRIELEINQGLYLKDKEWQSKNYEFLRNHEYYTEYGRTVLSQFKEINVQAVKEKLQLIPPVQ
ncbi:HD domain-containing protein [Flavobacteriaceae bacterium W22]|nr:HD domain-containing protein [Flavobacteriaceae bacterium W22]